MERFVHFDLKGAPPRVEYLEQVFKSIKSWGATGVILEWEDTFPYSGDLEDIGSVGGSGGDGVYSAMEVIHMLSLAKENGLKVVQLIQTIGHMEFVLKHPKFSLLRELEQSPAVLCPSKADSKRLVYMMLEQALQAQPEAEYLHIGADEVWYLGACPDCQSKASSHEHGAAALYLEHIQDIALFLRQSRPNLNILMWDDMLRNISPEVLNHYEFCKVVQPVVWDYKLKDFFRIDPSLWIKYAQFFPSVWAGSAYKGANGSCEVQAPPLRYVSNHEAWVAEMKNISSHVNFAGIVLTGWSRYDHYATLCELLPVALTSLANCLRVLNENGFGDQICLSVGTDRRDASQPWGVTSQERAGAGLASALNGFVQLRARSDALVHGDAVRTWLNAWQIENGYTNPAQVRNIVLTAKQLLAEFEALQPVLITNLNSFTGKRSSNEWLRTFFEPILKKVLEVHKMAEERCNATAGVRPLYM